MRRSYFRLGLCFEITWLFAAIASNERMLAANSATQGRNKVARSGRKIEQNEVPKPGPQNRQFCGDAWAYPHSSLRIRVEARANTIERAVIDQQIQFLQTTVQPYPTEDLRTADTSCPSRTSAEHFT